MNILRRLTGKSTTTKRRKPAASRAKSPVNRSRGHGKKTGTSGARGKRTEPYQLKKGRGR